MYPQVLFKNRKPDRIATLEEYRAGGGYAALEQTLESGRPKQVEKELLEATLLGRGGAGFPAGMKVETVADDAPHPRYVVCNADEMEPGTFKDRVLIHADPHLLIEGMLLLAYTIDADQGIIFIRPEYETAAVILEREISIARAQGLLGDNILQSGFNFDLMVHRSGGRYICGEVTAQINAIMGFRPNPTKPPPYPTVAGLWDLPTLTQNVETICCVPGIVANGAQWFKDLSPSDTAAGTKIYAISGRVNRPGCYELPVGVKLSELIETHAGGMPTGSRFKACLPGGASTGFLTAEHYDIALDFEALKKAGNRLGTAAVMIFDQNTCMVAATLNLMQFFARESCGWCTPCREGLPFIRDILQGIEEGRGTAEQVAKLKTMSRDLYNAYCAFAPGAAAPLESLLNHFEDEVMAHIEQQRCPLGTTKPQVS